MTEPPWLSLTEAAEHTGLHCEAVRTRARRGLIPSRKGNSGELLVQIVGGRLTRARPGMTGIGPGK